VVGIVGDVRERQLEGDIEAMVYVPYSQYPRREVSLVARTACDPLLVISLPKLPATVDLPTPGGPEIMIMCFVLIVSSRSHMIAKHTALVIHGS